MRKYQPDPKSGEVIAQIPRIHKDRVLKAFQQLGFSEDFKNLSVTVLRQTEFPFRRITIPNIDYLSSELIRLYLVDTSTDADDFYAKIESQGR